MPILLQISIEVNSGSVGRIAEQIGEVVLENGWESYITFARRNNPSKSNTIRIGSNLDVYRHVLETRILDNHCFSSKSATESLIDKIKKIQPDIIHLHHLHGYYINVEILFKYLKNVNVPIVWTFHDCWSFTGHCTNFDFVGCEKWKTICHECEQKSEYPKSLFLDRSRENFYSKKRIFNSLDKLYIVSVSQWLDSIVAQSFLSKIPRQVIYNGVDINLFSESNYNYIREKYCIGNKFIILGVATNWDKRKGFEDFLKLSKMINSDELIVLVGLNNSQIKNLPNNIIGIKRTENSKELAEFYSAADIFINLSVEETFGLTTAEALSCGTPAIVYDTTACPEVVNADTGFIVKKQDLSGVLEKIAEVKLKPSRYYSSACRKRAITLFNKSDRYMEYLQLYNRLLKQEDEIK
jgi:putative colanic acid biosynthesis glycosyltransferase